MLMVFGSLASMFVLGSSLAGALMPAPLPPLLIMLIMARIGG